MNHLAETSVVACVLCKTMNVHYIPRTHTHTPAGLEATSEVEKIAMEMGVKRVNEDIELLKLKSHVSLNFQTIR